MYKKLLTVFQQEEGYRDFSTVEVLFDVLFYKYLGPTVLRHGLSLEDVADAQRKIIDVFCETKHRNVLASLISHLPRCIELVAESKTEAPRNAIHDVMRRLEEILNAVDNDGPESETIS